MNLTDVHSDAKLVVSNFRMTISFEKFNYIFFNIIKIFLINNDRIVRVKKMYFIFIENYL